MNTITLELHSDKPHYRVLSVTFDDVSLVFGALLCEEAVRQLCADPEWTVYVSGKWSERQ
jgi:hypothetical protein